MYKKCGLIIKPQTSTIFVKSDPVTSHFSFKAIIFSNPFRFFICGSIEPILFIVIPKYLYSFTIGNPLKLLPFDFLLCKNIIPDFFLLKNKFQFAIMFSKYFRRRLTLFCLVKNTRSSAKTNFLKLTGHSSSNSLRN